ncbi:hypothetical protein K474DRAFT_912204 [Panus rudis PR-1116 ss-1]|nr:hypothetical protein K474DRAFT_912204 [Panus rudis PR-1116 ss-1]
MVDYFYPPFDIYVHNYCSLIGTSVLYYDYLCTFTAEVSYIWPKPTSGASLIFLLNRYFSILVDIVVIWANFANFKTPESCGRYAFFRQIVLIIAQIIVCFICFLRTWALYGRSRRIMILILSVAAVLFVLACWSIIGQHSQNSVYNGCHQAISEETAIHLAVAWEVLFVYDLMIFILTVYKTFHERTRGGTVAILNDIVELIFRDGAVYFAVMACVNAANTLTFYFLSPSMKGMLSTFASSVSVTMMSRIMLNLHQSASIASLPPLSNGGTSTTAESTSMLFTSRIAMPTQVFGESFLSTDEDTRQHSHSFTNHERIEEGMELRELRDDGARGSFSPSRA